MKKFVIVLGLGLWFGQALADTTSTRPKVEDGNIPQGEVIIRSGTGPAIQEYSNGVEVYKVKVTPRKGRPYFLVDSDGNGSLDRIEWILYQW